MTLRFTQVHNLPPSLAAFGYQTFIASAGRWNFLLVNDTGAWTVSYRLRKPTREVSASSTMIGPFDTFEEAKEAANEKWREIKRMA